MGGAARQPALMPFGDFTHEEHRLRGEHFHVARAGAGPLIVFLHGLPRCWYLWRHQLAEFARDHLAVALDQRGYNLSSKPDGDWNYGVWPAVVAASALFARRRG